MDLRKTLSKPFKKAKQKLVEVGHKRDGRSGSDNSRGGRETDVEGGEASKRSSHLHPEVQGVEIGPSRGRDNTKGKEVGRADPSADKNKTSRKSTASATGKLLLRGVRDSADAFGPLKSVAGGLCFILENCEVRSSSHVRYPKRLCGYHSEQRQISKG